MKTLLSLFLLLALGASAATGIKISEYPNTPVLTNSELFIVAVTNVTPATNRNISYGQLRSLLSSNNFIGSFTGDGRNVSNVVASYVAGTLSNNISGNAAVATNLYVSVKTFGAKGDGLNDDTGAFRLAAFNNTIYVPIGTYKVSSFTNLSPCAIVGEGPNSVVLLSDIIVQSSDLTLRNLTIQGNDSCTGIVCNSTFNLDANSVSFTHCAIGAILDGVFAPIPTNHSSFFDCSFRDCGIGISTGDWTSGGEYFTINGCTINSNRVGLLLRAGNTILSASHVDNNDIGFIIGNSGNGGHSVMSGNTFNHNGACYITNVPNGLSFVGNEMWFGTLNITNCSIRIEGCTISTVVNVESTNLWTAVGNYFTVNGIIHSTSGTFLGNFGVNAPVNNVISPTVNCDSRPYTSTNYNTDLMAADVSLISTNLLSGGGGILGLGSYNSGYRVLSAALRGSYEGSGFLGSMAFYTADNTSLNRAMVLDSSKNLSVSNNIFAYGNISSSGAVFATNAFVMPPVNAGPDWCTNGLAAMWNSNNNGQATIYLRTSAVGATTYADKLVAP